MSLGGLSLGGLFLAAFPALGCRSLQILMEEPVLVKRLLIAYHPPTIARQLMHDGIGRIYFLQVNRRKI